jgi:hypothetical protein
VEKEKLRQVPCDPCALLPGMSAPVVSLTPWVGPQCLQVRTLPPAHCLLGVDIRNLASCQPQIGSRHLIPGQVLPWVRPK